LILLRKMVVTIHVTFKKNVLKEYFLEFFLSIEYYLILLFENSSYERIRPLKIIVY
jgi:hypothetical protein